MSTPLSDRPAVAVEAREQLLASSPVAERRIIAAGLSTAVLECGEGPPVVLLHGPAELAAGWLPIVDGLAASHRVIAPDLPGHGESQGGVDLTTTRVLRWLADVVEETCAAPPAIVGRVVGGAIAARFAVDHPDRVSQLVLVDTLGLARFEPAPQFGAALHSFFAAPNEETYDELMSFCMYDAAAVRDRVGDGWPAFAAYVVDRVRTPGVLEAAGALIERFGAPIPEAELLRIAAPTTLIWGRHDLATPLAVAELASQTFGWPLHVVENAADDPAFEQPEAFLDVLREVLR